MGHYKIYAGLPRDAKLATVAKLAGFRRGEVLAVWLALLDHASTANPRGSVKDIDAEEIAATLECDAAAIESVIAQLQMRKMILQNGSIAGWDKYQKLSTARTRAHRARVAAAAIYKDDSRADTERRARLLNKVNIKRGT